MISLRKSVHLQLPKVVLLLLLIVLVSIGAVPGYLSGKWRWAEPPKIATLSELNNLRNNGITLPGWKTIDRRISKIGEHKWLVQAIEADQSKAILLFFPQKGPRDQPEVEWSDISGYQRWKTDSFKQVEFAAPQAAVSVTARFFRGWTNEQNYAVLQWYASSKGGHPAPSHWFFADRIAQWQNRRVPWVAVSVLVPIEPLDEVEKHWPKVKSLAESIQATLMAGPLRSDR